MFRGLHEHTIDAKGRMSLPVRFREQLASTPSGDAEEVHFILTTGIDKCLVLYPVDQWKAFEEKLAGLSQFDPAVVAIRRIYLAGATEITLDKNGRLLIPPMLREHAGLRRDVVWAGMGQTVELWAKELWNIQAESSRSDKQAVSSALAGLGL
jgi:MraZ protein